MQICHTIITEKAHLQYGCRCAVQRRHTISTGVSVQYGYGTLSVYTQVCSTELPKLLRGVFVVVSIWENDLLEKTYFFLDFILLWLYPDVADILLVAC